LADVVAALGATINDVVVTRLEGSTFYAELRLGTPSGPTVVSARPSDAVALAIRTDAPLFVADDLMALCGLVLPEEELADEADELESEEEEVVVEEFLEFLDTIRPEDFSG
jgi:hypothetical protein